MPNRQTLKTIDRLTIAALKKMTDEKLGAVTLGKLSDYDEFTNEELLAIVNGTASPELVARFDAAGAAA